MFIDVSRLDMPIKSRRKPPFIIQQLEARTMPASFSAIGTVLTADLALNDAVTILSVGTSYSLTLASGTWTGTDDANVVGNNSAVLTITTAGLVAYDTINVTDSGTGAAAT